MAIVGSLTAYAVYRLAAGKAALESPRRIMAAALAGYVSINVAALMAAIEFGIQPIFYRDAGGAPLYAPYPLHVTIPAMMIGHLTIAGMAELVISGGVVAYLQRTDPQLLRTTAPGAVARGWASTKPLWAALAVLMVLTPLGILATGSAWGEWAPQDFAAPSSRAQIAAASGNQMPPPEAPKGLRRLASIWTAPMPGYAPPVLKSQVFGYMLSAFAGTGLIILVFLLAGWIAQRRPG